jgi:hypothetical protein
MRLRVPYDGGGKRLHFYGISSQVNGGTSRAFTNKIVIITRRRQRHRVAGLSDNVGSWH